MKNKKIKRSFLHNIDKVDFHKPKEITTKEEYEAEIENQMQLEKDDQFGESELEREKL